VRAATGLTHLPPKLSIPGEVLVSHTVRDLVAGFGLAFEVWGTDRLNGVPDEWRPIFKRSSAESRQVDQFCLPRIAGFSREAGTGAD
jgi:hypothetical protein